ncbi:MAG: 1-aminocyclopropane-1-carboxylate deaminase/D-cysteine desulfhydrase, partial [Chitinophagaceae bacterium]
MSLPHLHFPSKLPVQTIAQNFSGGVDVLRLDQLHPVISGNKWFKLKEHLHLAVTQKASGLVTYGGAWSNHLVAVAYAAQQLKIPSAGIVRGEEPPFSALSQTLKDCLNYGMALFFMSREEYARKDELSSIALLQQKFPEYHRIPEGAADAAGVHGAATIVNTVTDFHEYTHICCSIGTGTMLAGLASACAPHQTAIGFSVF